MKTFGLIGYPLSHSFSKRYFTEKFQKENISDSRYEVFEIPSIEELPQVLKANPHLKGLNVTIPYKEEVIPFLKSLNDTASKVGAVNVIKVGVDGALYGFNSDYYGFRTSLLNWLPAGEKVDKALILGTGGAAKAVRAVLEDLNIEFKFISRKQASNQITYDDLDQIPNLLKESRLIINTTPLGMSPNLDKAPKINYDILTSNHFLFDLIYNPEETLFLKKGKEKGASIKNGLEMLVLQAEKSWEIWNS